MCPVDVASNGREDALQELVRVGAECAAAGWDGEGSRPVTEATLQTARSLLTGLPADLPSPDVGAEPDGNVGLDWHAGENRWLVVSCGPQNRVFYAARFSREDGIEGRGYLEADTEAVIHGTLRSLLRQPAA